jgi:hypothetical protein
VTTLMWEVRAAPGRVDELVAFADTHADPGAFVYRSADRVVVIDPSGRGLPETPAELVARPPHAWRFDAVPRVANRRTAQDSSRRGRRERDPG